MNKYTVLLLRPNYIAADYGLDTYTAHVTADNAVSAVVQAQNEVFVLDHREANNPQDYACVGLFDGHQINRVGY